MKTLNNKWKLMVIVAIVSIAGIGASLRTRAQDQQPPPVPDRALFGLVGITRNQVARLSVSNIHALLIDGLPPGPIRVEMSFVDADGNPLLTGDGQVVRRVVMLEAGHSAFLQIEANNLLSRDANRLNFRPVVSVQPPPVGDRNVPPPTNDRIVPTFEVIEGSTARTVLLYPGVIRGFNPQPDPPRE